VTAVETATLDRRINCTSRGLTGTAELLCDAAAADGAGSDAQRVPTSDDATDDDSDDSSSSVVENNRVSSVTIELDQPHGTNDNRTAAAAAADVDVSISSQLSCVSSTAGCGWSQQIL